MSTADGPAIDEMNQLIAEAEAKATAARNAHETLLAAFKRYLSGKALGKEAAACRLDEDPTKRDAIVAAMLEEAEERYRYLQDHDATEKELWDHVAQFEGT